MRLAELTRDTTLVPAGLNREERSMRGGFIVIRVLKIRSAAPDPTDIPTADVPALRSQLTTEIAQAVTAYNSINTLVTADATANKLLPLSGVDRRMRNSYIALDFIPDSLTAMRTRLVRHLVWWSVAVDSTLLAPAKIGDLHLLVDRRLRVVERMLYDVGRVNHAWQANEIYNNKSGPWKDGWSRMFEYPRLPQKLGDSGNSRHVFKDICNPDATAAQVCQDAALSDWHVKGVEHIHLRDTTRLNPDARPLWERPPLGGNYVFYQKTGADPVQAIEKLFTPSDDYKKRNLLFCDHVIHLLNIESLLWAKKKRSANTSWLTGYIGGVAGKLRIHVPFWNGPVFLAGQNDGTFFEYQRIHRSNLQIGDHLIVYNHPAYDKATVGGVWRLENALVVGIYPGLKLQGHGTNPKTIDQMKQDMIGLFNRELNRLRQRVDTHLASGSADTEIDFGGSGKLVRRVDPANSTYIATHKKADWWLRWNLDSEKDEAAIAADPARKALALERHKVEYDATHGYFPIWEPVLRSNGTPIKNGAGKITRIQRVTVSARMVAAWTWYLPVNVADRDKLPVLRPRL
jgi:hypothetical protein